MRIVLVVLLVGLIAAGCGCGEITREDQYNKDKQLSEQAQKYPGDGGIER